jgi:hypothetical protein
MLSELRRTYPEQVLILEDNQTCIQMATNPVVSAHNRHFAMRMWWLRSEVEQQHVRLQYVSTDVQLADIFTKVLPSPRFLELRTKLMDASGLADLQHLLILSARCQRKYLHTPQALQTRPISNRSNRSHIIGWQAYPGVSSYYLPFTFPRLTGFFLDIFSMLRLWPTTWRSLLCS